MKENKVKWFFIYSLVVIGGITLFFLVNTISVLTFLTILN